MDGPEARRDAEQALYSLIMNVAEAASQGQMPDGGLESLTRLACRNVVDTFANLT
jgi:hypothetical protein